MKTASDTLNDKALMVQSMRPRTQTRDLVAQYERRRWPSSFRAPEGRCSSDVRLVRSGVMQAAMTRSGHFAPVVIRRIALAAFILLQVLCLATEPTGKLI